MLVVSTGEHAVNCVAECDGEDSGGVGSVDDGTVEDLPGLAAVRGVEDAGGAASGGEPDVGIGSGAEDGEGGIAGGECAFAFEGGWELTGRDVRPGLAVGGEKELEFQFAGFVGDGVAENDAVSGIPEDHGVKKSFGICVGELDLPVTAAVGSVVNAGLVAGAGGHQEGFVGGEGNDGAEVERFGAGDLVGDPDAAVGGAKVGAVRAGCPCDLARNGAYAAEAFGGVGGVGLGRGLSQGGGGEEGEEGLRR